MTSIYKTMRIINKLLNNEITELNKADSETVFEKIDDEVIEILIYLGCDINRTADLLNIKLPDNKFSRTELQTQKRLETMYNF